MTLLRCRAGENVGLGHLVRCRVLADLLVQRGRTPVIIGPSQDLRNQQDNSRFEQWIERPDWSSAASEAAFHLEIAQKTGSREIILDDYRSDGEHQRLLRQGGLRCLQQYDASRPQRFAANVVVNSSPFERRSYYERDFLESRIETLMGPKYAVLRPEIANIKQRAFQPRSRNLLITFGGGDDRGAIEKVMYAMADQLPAWAHVTIMIGASHPNSEEISRIVETLQRPQTDLKINPANPLGIICDSDLAILAGGTTTFEAAYFGVPMVLLPIAENQHNQCIGWEALGAAICPGPLELVPPQIIADQILKLFRDPDRRARMSNSGLNSVDTLGAQRLIDRLLDHSFEG